MNALSAAASSNVMFQDPLGERRHIADPSGANMLELLCLRSELTSVPSFEFALRERVGRLANFRHAYYGRVRSVDRLNDGSTLAIVSERVPGVRLSELLGVVERRQLTLDINAALSLIRQLVPAVALLHEHARDVAHGALGPERLVITPNARLVIVEHVLGAALEQLRFSHERYWDELRIPVPRASGLPRFDHRTDVLQIGVIALSLVLGRPIQLDEFPSQVGDVVASAWAISARGGLEPLPSGLRSWLTRALQLDPRNSFPSAVEARFELDRMFGDSDYIVTPHALEAFLAQCQDVRVLEGPLPGAKAEPPAGARTEPGVSAQVGPAVSTKAEPPSVKVEPPANAKAAPAPAPAKVEPPTAWKVEPLSSRVTDPLATFDSEAPLPIRTEPPAAWKTEPPASWTAEAPVMNRTADPLPSGWKPAPPLSAKADPSASWKSDPMPTPKTEPPAAWKTDPVPAVKAGSPAAWQTDLLPTVKEPPPTWKAEPPAGWTAEAPASQKADPITWKTESTPAPKVEPPAWTADFPTVDKSETVTSWKAGPTPIASELPAWRAEAATPTTEPASSWKTEPAAGWKLEPAASPVTDSSVSWKTEEAALPAPMPLVNDAAEEDEVMAYRTPRRRWPVRVAVVAGLVALVAGAAFAGRQYFAATASAPATGTLMVSTNPGGAQVTVDGVLQGVTPINLTLNAGAHAVELRTGNDVRSIPVVIAAGTHATQYIELPKATVAATGQLQVRTEPGGAQVTVDGVPRGRSPLTIGDLSPGTHTVVLESESGSMKQDVTIDAGVTASLVVPLAAGQGAPVSGWISVTAPVTMQLFENGRLLGSSESDRIMVSAGRHDIEVTNQPLAYKAVHTVQVVPGRVAPIKIELPKQKIALNAVPWAEVWIDGEKIGETPIGDVSIAVGPHEILFRHPQFGEQRHAITVTAAAPARLSVDMRKAQ